MCFSLAGPTNSNGAFWRAMLPPVGPLHTAVVLERRNCVVPSTGGAAAWCSARAVFSWRSSLWNPRAARGARILAEIVGHAGTADIPHVRGWDSSGEGLARCMSAGARGCPERPSVVDLVGAGAMSHSLHDRIEARAIRRVFGDIRVPVTALASRFGVSSVTAPAAICAIVLGMVDGFVPSGVAYEQPDPECAIEVAHGPARFRRHPHRDRQRVLARGRQLLDRHSTLGGLCNVRELDANRQLIAQLSSSWTDSGSLSLVSVLTASGGSLVAPRCSSERLLDLLNRQWSSRGSPDSPAHPWAERPNSSTKRQSSSTPHIVELACGTAICSAESGGSRGRSSKRCVVGSPYFWAERSTVGSQLEICLRIASF